MKALKITGIVIGVILLLFLLTILVLPSESHVERSIVINASSEKVFRVVNNFKRFNDWSPWASIDPDTKYVYEGPAMGEGAKMSWVSDHSDVGSGAQWIVESVPNKLVRTELQFEGFEDVSEAAFIIEELAEGQTKVTWAFDAEMKGVGKIFGVMMDGMLGPMYEEGLENLKSIVESAPDYSAEITLESTEPVAYLGIKKSMEVELDDEEVGEVFTKIYTDLEQYMQKNNIQSAGPPLTVYHEIGEQSYVMEPGIPVKGEVAVEHETINRGAIPASNAVKAVHVGDYSELEQTYKEVEKFIKENKLTAKNVPWEVYVIGPGNEQDSTKWTTNIYFPIEGEM